MEEEDKKIERKFLTFCKYCVFPARKHVTISYIRSQFKLWAGLDSLKSLQSPQTISLLKHHFETESKIAVITRKKAYVKITLVYPEVLSLQQCVVKKLIETPSIWIKMWLSPQVWSLPIHLRHWLLVCGIQLAPQLFFETLWSIDNKPVWDTSSTEPLKKSKKRKAFEGENETISINEAENLLANLKKLFSTTTPSATRLRSLPVQMKKKSSILEQMEKHWEPTLAKIFGSLQKFLMHITRTKSGSAGLAELIEAGCVTKEVAEAMKRAVTADVVSEWRDKVQELQNKKLVLAVNSTHISQSGYESLASWLRLQPVGLPTCSPIQDLHDLPLSLQFEEFPSIVARTIQEKFITGWAVTWESNDWIESMVVHNPDAVGFLLDPKQLKNRGWWLRKLYDLHNASFQTPERLQCLQDVAEVNQNKKRAEWDGFVSRHPEWQDVPDASYVAFRWFKELNPRKRRRSEKVDDIKSVALPPFSTVQKETRKLLIGQLCANKRYKNAASGAALADKFSKGYIPIGCVGRNTLQGSQNLYSSRILSLSTAIIWLTTLAVKGGLLSLKESPQLICSMECGVMVLVVLDIHYLQPLPFLFGIPHSVLPLNSVGLMCYEWFLFF